MTTKVIYIERKTIVSDGVDTKTNKHGVNKYIVSTFKCSWINLSGVILEPGHEPGGANKGVMIYSGTYSLLEDSNNRIRVYNDKIPKSRGVYIATGSNVSDTVSNLLVGESWNGSSLVGSTSIMNKLISEIRSDSNIKLTIYNGKNSNAKQGTEQPTNKKVDYSNHMAVKAARNVSKSAGASSLRKCAKYWRLGHQKAGFKFTPKPSAYQYVGVMPSLGFVKIPEPEYPQVGDTRIFQPHRQTSGGGGVHGHIEVWDGSYWCSDYKSKKVGRKGLPNAYYRKVHDRTTWWRHKDLVNASDLAQTAQSTELGEDGTFNDSIEDDLLEQLEQLEAQAAKANDKANEAAKKLIISPEEALASIQDLPQLLYRRAAAIEMEQRGEETGWAFDINAETEVEAVLNAITVGASYMPEIAQVISSDKDYGKIGVKDLVKRVYPHSRYVNPFYYEVFGKEFHRDMSVKPLYFWPQHSILNSNFIKDFDAAALYKSLYENKYKTALMGKYIDATEITDQLEESARDSVNNDDHDNPEAMFLMMETRYIKGKDNKERDEDNLYSVYSELLQRMGLSKAKADILAKGFLLQNPLAGSAGALALKAGIGVGQAVSDWVTGDTVSTYTGEFPDNIKAKFGSLQASKNTNIGNGYPPTIRAAMDFISRCEGTHEAQGHKGYGEFSGYNARGRELMQRSLRGEIGHPTNYNGTKGWSSAAGRYQAMGKTGPDTWRLTNKKLGKKGFDGQGDAAMTVKNQDEFFVQKLKDRNVYNEALQGNWQSFLSKGGKGGLAGEWASIPINSTGLAGAYSGQGSKLDRKNCLTALTHLQKFYEGAKAGTNVTVDGANVIERASNAVSTITNPTGESKYYNPEKTYTENGNMSVRVKPKAGTLNYKAGVGKVNRATYETLMKTKTYTEGEGIGTVIQVKVLDAGLLEIKVRDKHAPITFMAVVNSANLPKKAAYTGHTFDEYKAEEAKKYAENFLKGKYDFKVTIMSYDTTLGVVRVSVQKKQPDGKFLYYASHMLEKGFAIPNEYTNDNGKALSEKARKAKEGMWTDPDKVYTEIARAIVNKTAGVSDKTTRGKPVNFPSRTHMWEIFIDQTRRKPTTKYNPYINFNHNSKTNQWITTTTFSSDSGPSLKDTNSNSTQLGIALVTPLPGKLSLQKTQTPGGIVATVTTDVKDLVLKYYNLHEKSLELCPIGQEKTLKAGDKVGYIRGPGKEPEAVFEAIFREVPFNPLSTKNLADWPVNKEFDLHMYLNQDAFKSTTNAKVVVSDYEWVRTHTDGGIVTIGNGAGIDSLEGGRAGSESLSETQAQTYAELRGHNYDKVMDPKGEGPLRDAASVFSNTMVYTNVLRNFLKPFEYGNSLMVPQIKAYVIVGNEDDDYYSEGVTLRSPIVYELPPVQSFSLSCNNDYNPVDVARFSIVNPSHMLSAPLYYDPNKEIKIGQAHTQFFAPSFMEKARIKAGTKISFKIGYTNNPNFNPTVFNGVIKEVGGARDYILECIAEGYGAELLNSEYGSEKPINFTNGHNASTGSIFGISLLDESISHFGARMGKWKSSIDYIGSIFRDQHVDEFASGAEWQNDTIFEGKGRIGDMRDPENKAMVAPWSWGDNIFNLWYPTRANLANRVYMNIYSDVIESVQDDFMTHPALWLNLLTWDKSANWRYYAYKATPWAIMKEMEYRHPGTVAKPLIYDERMTMFFGIPFQNYIATDLNPHFMMSAALSNRFENLNNPYTETYLKVRTTRMQPALNYHLLHSDINIISNRMTLNRDFYTRVNVLEFNRTFDGHEPNSSSDVITMTLDDNLASHEIRTKTIAMGGTHKELTAYFYGTQELKKEAEKMYGGEIIIVGNPHIKAGDYAYLSDRVRGLSGTIKIRECEHYIDEHNGYITVITPGLWVEPSQFAWSNHLTVFNALGKFSSELLSEVSVESLLEDMATYQAIALASTRDHEHTLSNLLISGGGTALFATLAGRYAVKFARKIGIERVKLTGSFAKSVALGVLDTAKAYGTRSLAAIQESKRFQKYGGKIVQKVGDWKYIRSLGKAAEWVKGVSGSKPIQQALKYGVHALTKARGLVTFLALSNPLGWLVAAATEMVFSFVMAKVRKERLTRQPISFVPLTYNYGPYVAGVEGFTNNTYLEALVQNAKQVWKTTVKAKQYYTLNHSGGKNNNSDTLRVTGANNP